MKVSDVGEGPLIRRLARLVPGRADVVKGIGDDCAVVRTGRRDPFDLLLKSDPIIEGVHFTADARAEAVGHKALARVLSDIAAMGGEPLWALIDLVAPATASVARLEGLYRGIARLARRHGVAIVGGDTSKGSTLELHVFAVGRLPKGSAVLRSGARKGDGLYVTGRLGGSGAGRHLTFAPRLAEGVWLRQAGWATAMMDLSDGLATDLRRMSEASGVGAILDPRRIPVSAAARKMGGSSLLHALSDGEDFELLFTVPARRQDAFEEAWRRKFTLRCSRIGEMGGEPGALGCRSATGITALDIRGYEHFATQDGGAC